MLLENKINLFKILNVLSFVVMVSVNAAANILPINGVTSGKVSDSYPNLFAPAGVTFSIWGLIYLLLFGFVIFQFFNPKSALNRDLFKYISFYFIVSSLANAAWIFSWHYRLIPVSMILIVVILISLILINNKLNSSKTTFTFSEKLFLKLPFSIYFGWLTVATIANMTVLLVSINWNRFNLSQEFWTITILVVGSIIGITTTIKNKDIAYGLVIMWAYLGILTKHISVNGFYGLYPQIIKTVIILLVIIFTSIIYVVIKEAKCCKKMS